MLSSLFHNEENETQRSSKLFQGHVVGEPEFKMGSFDLHNPLPRCVCETWISDTGCILSEAGSLLHMFLRSYIVSILGFADQTASVAFHSAIEAWEHPETVMEIWGQSSWKLD